MAKLAPIAARPRRRPLSLKMTFFEDSKDVEWFWREMVFFPTPIKGERVCLAGSNGRC